MGDEAEKLAPIIRPQAFIFGDRHARVCSACGAPPKFFCPACCRYSCASHKCCNLNVRHEFGSPAYTAAEERFMKSREGLTRPENTSAVVGREERASGPLTTSGVVGGASQEET